MTEEGSLQGNDSYNNYNYIDVGDEFPDFTLDSQLGPISYHTLIEGKWGLIVTFHKSFDPVATTDIGMVCKLIDEFESRNISVITLGNDTVSNYRRWIKDIEELQEVKVNLPLVSDPECLLLRNIGCAKISPLTEEFVTTSSSVFLIDLDKRVRTILKYSPLIGRNIYEIIRLYDALQVATYHQVVCPVNWSLGQDCVVNPSLTDKQANQMLPKGFVAIKPWFRLTPSPDSK